MSLDLEKGNEIPKGLLTIKAYRNNFLQGNNSYGRVEAPSSRVSVSNLSALIADRHAGVEPALVNYIARLLNDETMRQLKMGKSVEALGLGTVYIATKGTIKGANPGVKDVPKMVIKFKSSKVANTSLKDVKASLVVPMEILPTINIVEDMKEKTVNTELKKGTVVKITGKRLRVEGSVSSVGLYFVNTAGLETKIPSSEILRNEPSTLEFILPASVGVGTYTIKIVNQARIHGGFAKRARTGESEFNIQVK